MKRTNLLLAVLTVCLAATTANAQKYVGGDISMLPEYEAAGSHYYTSNGTAISNVLTYLKDQGLNSMRVRLFVDPSKASAQHKGEGVRQDLEYVKKLGKRIKDAGLHFLLDFHYSDTWTDPGKHSTPSAWQSKTATELAEQMYTYTKESLTALQKAGAEPDAIQVGNELNVGQLWNTGKTWPSDPSSQSMQNFISYINNAVKACREVCPQAKVVFHVAMNYRKDYPVNNNDQAKNWSTVLKNKGVDYDIFGLSYYPYYHGAMSELETLLTYLETNIPDKKIQLVEMGYPHKWYPGDAVFNYTATYPDTNEGQRKFTADLITLLNQHANVNGLYWWWPEANEYWRKTGVPQVTTSWYNMSLWDNENGKALPALYELKNFVNDPAGIEQISNTHHLSHNTSCYNLLGQRLQEGKGLCVANGKKFIVK